jgi:hypothetical protein
VWIWLSWQVTLFAALGAVVWFRRFRDAAMTIVPFYLASTVLWPYVNERRAILVVPVLAAWYVLGLAAAWSALASWASSRRRMTGLRVAAGIFIAAAVIGPLLPQMSRDYLFASGKSSSHFGGARYTELLSHLGGPSDVVETDYMSSVALFTGHRTNINAFQATVDTCDTAAAIRALAADKAGFLLLGDVNKPDLLDRPCLLKLASSDPLAVELLHTSRDNATVFELIGAGTGHPQLQNLDAGASPDVNVAGDRTVVSWNWSGPAAVEQVSLGQADFGGGDTKTESVELELHRPGGGWTVVASARSPVDDSPGAAPYLLATFANGTVADGLAVVVTGSAAGGPATVEDASALGSTAPARSGQQ